MRRPFLIAALIVLAAASHAHAGSYSWTGAADGPGFSLIGFDGALPPIPEPSSVSISIYYDPTEVKPTGISGQYTINEPNTLQAPFSLTISSDSPDGWPGFISIAQAGATMFVGVPTDGARAWTRSRLLCRSVGRSTTAHSWEDPLTAWRT
jgi:hypothetical protein